MNKIALYKKLTASCGRIVSALVLILGITALIYWLWNPGASRMAGKFDVKQNAIWLGHGWLGDDKWFERNRRDITQFRSIEKIDTLLQRLGNNHIKYVYPHLCPAQSNGAIAAYNSTQLERFFDVAQKYDLKVIPWIGGVWGTSARIDEVQWRKIFVASVKELLDKHPRLAGVQINIEPLPSGNLDFLTLLDELRPVLQGRILGVAAYPPPTKWHPHPNVHWELNYIHEVASRCDQMAVMMYDTAIKFEKFYISLMRQWSNELGAALDATKCQLLLGLPAYEDVDVSYHRPAVENLRTALSGIQAAGPSRNYVGCAIYCEWEMTPEKWQVWQEKFLDTSTIKQ